MVLGVFESNVLNYIYYGFCISGCDGVDMQGVELVGGTGEYMEVSKDIKYQLSCPYRAGYDDLVEQVRWKFYGQPVYIWETGRTTISGNLYLIL